MNAVKFLSVMILVFESLFMCQCESRSNNHHSNNEITQNNNKPRKDATFYGAANVNGGVFDNVTVNGAGTVNNITATTLKINGAGTITKSTIDKTLTVNGGTTLNDVIVHGQFIGNGGVTINDGSFEDVVVRGGVTVKNAKISGKLECRGGVTIIDTTVAESANLFGGIKSIRSEFAKDLELCWGANGKMTFEDCTISGSVSVKKNNPVTGWFGGLFDWFSSSNSKIQELVLKNTVIDGDVTFEEDTDVKKVIYLHGSSKIIGTVKGATVIQK